jgi:hypothetical protein
MMIAMPFIVVLTLGLPDAEPAQLPFRLLADLGLIILVVLRFGKKSALTIVLECIVFFMLLSPLVRVLAAFPMRMFSLVGFFVPFGAFVVLYPLSIVFSWLEYRRRSRVLGSLTSERQAQARG